MSQLYTAWINKPDLQNAALLK